MVYSKKLWILIIVLFLLLLLNPRTINFMKENISPERNFYVVNEIKLPSGEQAIYEKFNQGVLKYSDGALFYYDFRGQQKWNVYVGGSNLLLKTGSEDIYLADQSKNIFTRMDDNGNIIYSCVLEEDIYNFKVCERNYVLIQHNSENSMNRFTLLNEKGEKENTFHLKGKYILSMALSKNNERIAVNSLRVNDNAIENKVYITDLKGNIIHSVSLANEMVFDLLYDKKGNLILVKEKGIMSINKNNEISWNADIPKIKLFKTDLEERIVIYSEADEKNKIVQGTGGKRVQIMQLNGKKEGEAALREEIIGLDFTEKNILCHSLKTVYILNSKGQIITEFQYYNNISKAYYLSEDYIVIASKEKLSFIKLHK